MIFPTNAKNLPVEIRKFFEFSLNTITKIGGVSIVVPVRGTDRQPNLNYCISRLLMQNVDNLEIIVSEEDSNEKIKLDKFQKDSRVRKIFTRSGPTSFNKSIAVNVGVLAAKYDKVLMNDADIVPPKGYVQRLDEALNQYDSFFVGQTIYNVNLVKSGIMWAGSKRTDYFSGGSIGFKKEKYIEIGGMCEKFYGYGSEDCEFWGRVSRLTKMYENRDTVLLHLNHRRATLFSVNVDVYNDLMNQNMEVRLQNLRDDLQKRFGVSKKHV